MQTAGSEYRTRNRQIAVGQQRRRWRRVFLSLLASAVMLVGQFVRADDLNEPPLELRSYRVLMLVATDAPQQSKQACAELLEKTRQTANRCLGSQWRLNVDSAEWLHPVNSDRLSRLSPEEIGRQAGRPTDDFDVLIVATIGSQGSGWKVSLRSWQPAVNVQSGVIDAEIYDWMDVPLALLRSGHAAFHPLGVVDAVDGKQVRVILQASALSTPDEMFAIARSAKVFAPVLASRKRDKSIDRLQPIPWTFLTAVETQDSRLACELQSGLRSPIGGKQRGRVETMAIAVKAELPSTRLELVTQSRPSLPLAAHRIELRSSSEIPKQDPARPMIPEADPHLRQVMLTDRRGCVTVPASSGQVVWVFAYSGKQLLARVPMVPGNHDQLRLEVPDDSSRLETESELYILQGQLVEAVAARNTAAARIRAAVKKNDEPLAKAAAAELLKQPGTQAFLNQLLTIRVPAIKVAKARKDRAGESRINRMCDEMAELIQQYLSEDKRQTVLEELKELFSEDEPLEKKPVTSKSQ